MKWVRVFNEMWSLNSDFEVVIILYIKGQNWVATPNIGK